METQSPKRLTVTVAAERRRQRLLCRHVVAVAVTMAKLLVVRRARNERTKRDANRRSDRRWKRKLRRLRRARLEAIMRIALLGAPKAD